VKKKIIVYFIMIILLFTIQFQVYGETISQIDTEERKIDPNKPMLALTFDDGPSEKYTPEILDVLKENYSLGTFFVLGTEVEKNKELLNRMIKEGNQIGNHTYNHKNLTILSDEELSNELDRTQNIIIKSGDYTPSIMRPPYGYVNDGLRKKLYMSVVLWTLDTRDWENRNTEIICNNILENVEDGDIILMHDIYESTAEAVKIIVPELKSRGYQLVTVDELNNIKNK